MKYGIPCICKEIHALTWDFYWENTVVILELYRMWRSAFIYNFVFIQQYECLHHISVLSKGDIMSYCPFFQGVYSLVETRDE